MTPKSWLIKKADYLQRQSRRDRPWTDAERDEVVRRAKQLETERVSRGDDAFPPTGIAWMVGGRHSRRWS